MVPILAGSLLAAGAVALVAYLLWPTWGTVNAKGPERLPVSVGGTVFNVPVAAIRRKIQRHSGPQERVDLGYTFPALMPPEAPKHVSADTVEEQPQPIDRIFLSITAHRNSLAPDMRVRTIYPRYLEQARDPGRRRIDVARVQGRLALRQRGHVFGEQSVTGCAMHARCGNARHVPLRTPHRRRRSDVPFSAKLAGAVARRGGGDGKADGADLRAEVVSRVDRAGALRRRRDP